MKVAAILPAYNEAARISEVLKAVLRAASVDEVIVVNDGSSDGTAHVVDGFSDVYLIDLPVNTGKGGAMTAGAYSTDADILVFLDADLIGLKPEHVDSLVLPVLTGRVKMAVGSFRGGRRLTDWAQKITPNISGQRAIRRDVFEQIPDLENARYGVEMQITKFCHHYRVPIEVVVIPGVTHPMKEEKLGYVRGTLARMKMYTQIFRILLNPRAPKRLTRRRRTNILRKFAASERLRGRQGGAPYWVYRQERSWKKRRRSSRRHR